ncbi:23S rRNA m(5)U-1939 methyltransferase [Aneurinibacillus soli]|uniref:23S rRNA (Uracil-C(5))-methyltransferase RlmCD n=1 Tax=Aneurinibacillus soli TaxID=1500254 RepID=A0A0U5B4X8_9BACL|nr:23S rRNA (uracil(1939)-C(5))-methyltransferase RlmD [Aneurinibacillus soli]PYE61930.1 23S rRNA m(5)U-1939 methyltransferase [Aneurinibacillus soli]BAU29746.1 23S rRNA (uracil-C(5))-methyltransferase RlmCD [Aneurinibacillus soli]
MQKNKNTNQAGTVQLRIGQEILVTIKRIGINGEGIGYYKKKAVFIPGALPDEVVEVKITKDGPTFAEGLVKKIKQASAQRQKPSCPVYEECGGCQMQHVSYDGQLKAKEDIVRGAFARYMGTDQIPLRPILGMDEPWSYRNKAQLQVGTQDGRIAVGLYSPASHSLVDISGCPVQHPATNEMVQAARDVLEKLHIAPYNEKKRTGVVRTVVARAGFATGEQQLIFVTATNELPRKKEIVSELRMRLPKLTSVSHNINLKKTSLIFGDVTVPLWGEPYIKETLGDLTYALSPRAFFQLNPAQTIKLYKAAAEAAALTGNERVVDAYCGVGTIALWLARDAKDVRGIEIIPEAIEDAKQNAVLNGTTNATFYVGRAEELLPQWVKQGERPDVVVVDPPRTGCDRALLDAILRAKPARMVYVSCNPSTLAKDVAYLAKGYRIEWIQPVDMFPNTAHVESVCLLVKCVVTKK